MVNKVRDAFLKDDASSVVCMPYWIPICARIGTASASADCTSAEKIVAEDAALNAAVKLFETDAGRSSENDGTLIPSASSTARIVETKFFWTVRGTMSCE